MRFDGDNAAAGVKRMSFNEARKQPCNLPPMGTSGKSMGKHKLSFRNKFREVHPETDVDGEDWCETDARVIHGDDVNDFESSG